MSFNKAKVQKEIERCKAEKSSPGGGDFPPHPLTKELEEDIIDAVRSGRLKFGFISSVISCLRFGPYEDVDDAMGSIGI